MPKPTSVPAAAVRRSPGSLLRLPFGASPVDAEGRPQAACTGLDTQIFFARPSELDQQPNKGERAALAVCAVCPAQVRAVCLERDLAQSEITRINGVFGGVRQEERRETYRTRQQARSGGAV
ncbi:WhiB family transcriptional regulator [Streptomyces sp. ID05-39B]|uniref:WhiB family transcriptional regulator n=1 Tax=Streptomyces sp. ID05-39B TaxID=3028664 RepID=UPI0029AF1BED|nr:WhiB family transcriptional regulator [Streptomyces sp. ID05-39B]MDX3525990.1 WhiB family transcriptional regulator [Streptomyces sp. ID05-39B]